MELLGPKARKTMIKVKMIKLIELGETFTSREIADKLDVRTHVVSGILRRMVNEGCISRTRKGWNNPNEWKLLWMPPEWENIKNADAPGQN